MKKVSKIKVVYSVFRLIIGLLFVLNVIGIFIVQDDSQQSRLAFNAIQSLMIFIASILPPFIEKKAKIQIPDFMEYIFIITCIFHFILGEMGSFFIKYSWWDSMLHTLTGSMIAILGFSIVDSLNLNKNNMKIPPIIVAIFAVSFSISIGVIWEIFEYFVDQLTGSNMQRYLNSNTLEPLVGRNAIKDTMKDLILDTSGAIVFSVFGFIRLKKEQNAFSSWRFKKDKVDIQEDEYQKAS